MGALCALLCCGPASAKPASAAAAFDAGVRQYRAGEYSRALASFRSARKRGLDTPNLDLNLGLTYYRLGRHAEARTHFERVRRDLRYTAIADYHLGLLAGQQGQHDEALYHLAAVRRVAGDDDLRDMAGFQLSRFEAAALDEEFETPDFADPDGSYYLRLAAGYDSNPELASAAENRPLNEDGAAHLDLRGNLEHPLGKSGIGTTLFTADLSVREYQDEEGYDHLSGELGLRQSWHQGRWQLGVGGEGGASWLDGEAYQGIGGVQVDGRRRFGATRLTLRYRGQLIAGEGEYDYLEGWRHGAQAQVARALGTARGRAEIDLEHNDREGLARDGEFASYSPRRVGLAFAVTPAPLRDVTLELRSRLRRSSYRGTDRFEVDGEPQAARRADTLLSVGLRARRQGGADWNWLADYQYSRNDSSIERYGYARHIAAFGIEWLR